MATAKHDRLLAALIGRLPTPAGPWARDERIAWLRMMASAFEVVYGPCGSVSIVPDGTGAAVNAADTDTAMAATADANRSAPATIRRFHVDHDGFAMADGRPIAMEELPAVATLWDERIGPERGDVAAILWRDVGTTGKSLPPGVILKPAFDAA